MFQQVSDDYKDLRSLRGGIYVIEGIIAAGKTTLGHACEKYLNYIGIDAKFFPEYVNSQLLEQYIGDMKKYAYSFQLVMLSKRISIYNEAKRFADKGGVALVDRSIIGDHTFALMQKNKGYFTDSEWKIYNESMTQEILVEPDACIYLDISPEDAMTRIYERNRLGESSGYSMEYLIELKTSYEESLRSSQVCVIRIDYSEIDGYLYENKVKRILTKLKQ